MKKYVKIETLFKESQKVEIQIVKSEDLIGFPLESSAIKITIIKESDNIEELCDNFVEVYKALKNKVYEQPYFDIVSEQVWNGAPVGNLYGAIWTDKGLIYVAKMNNKGNLELI